MTRRPRVFPAVSGVVALLLGACGAQPEPPEASSSESESAPRREPSASLSNPETPTAHSPCPRPDVRAASPAGAGPLRYEVTALGLPDPSTSFGYAGLAINDAGQVVGTARIGGANGFDRAYRWTPGGRIEYIEGAQGQETMAHDVNASGQVAGDLWPASDGSQPFMWDDGTGLRALRVDVGAGVESVNDVRINDRGQVSGTLDTYGAGSVAFRMERDGTVSQAPVKQAEASDMNAGGEVVLTVEDEATSDRSFYVWQSGATFVEGGPTSWSSYPKINDAGLVVGATAAGEDDECGFAWDTRTGSRTTLGLGVSPNGLNGNGQATGVRVDGEVRHAFQWDSVSGLLDLGTVSGFGDSYGVAISDHGQVIGQASRWGRGDDRVTSFLWDPSAGLIELRPLRAEDSTFVAGINSSGIVVGVSGPLDPEEGLIMEGEPVIWSPTR